MPDYVLVLTTVPADDDLGTRLAHALVSERLAACVNLLPPMQSVYRWEGEIQEAAERQVVVKTERSQLDALRVRLAQLHSYDVPEFIVLPVVDGGEAYLRWIQESVTPGPG